MPDTKPHTFFVRLSAHGIGLNPGIEIPFERTNLPADAMQFRDNTELYWEVRIKSYSKDTAIVVVDVTDYEPEDITAFYSQQPRRDVHSIEFAELDWNHLSPHLSSYRKSAFVNLIGNTGNIDQTKSRIEQRTLDYQRRKENTGDQWLEFTMSFDKATFVTGGVLVTHKYKGQLLEILIPNGFILKEFDLLKHYIARVLETKRFRVQARITFTDDLITDIHATSPEIGRINEEMFEAVRYLQAKAARKTPPSDSDKVLFSADELIEEFGNEFSDNGLRLLEIILRDDKIRNKRQIMYLAGKHQVAREKILFTSHPQFGFVFIVQGKDMMHFIWELLNSHATYIWTYDPKQTSAKLAMRRLEYALSTIREQGRQAYRIDMPADIGLDQLHFSTIRHDKMAGSTSAGFAIWRARLQERLV